MYVQSLVHFSFCKRFSLSFYLVFEGHFSFYLVLVFQKDLVLVLV